MDPVALGLEKYLVKNAQLTASSEDSEMTRARNARLGLMSIVAARVGAWIASTDDTSPWLKVDFKSNVTLRAIATQGRFDEAEWVTSYEVSHSIDGSNFDMYEENGQIKVKIMWL